MEKDVPKEGSTQQLYANRNAARETREKFFLTKRRIWTLAGHPETRWMLLFVFEYFQVFGFTAS
jgi:hypothetical protein